MSFLWFFCLWYCSVDVWKLECPSFIILGLYEKCSTAALVKSMENNFCLHHFRFYERRLFVTPFLSKCCKVLKSQNEKKTRFRVKSILTVLSSLFGLRCVPKEKDIKNWPTELKILFNLFKMNYMCQISGWRVLRPL